MSIVPYLWRLYDVAASIIFHHFHHVSTLTYPYHHPNIVIVLSVFVSVLDPSPLSRSSVISVIHVPKNQCLLYLYCGFYPLLLFCYLCCCFSYVLVFSIKLCYQLGSISLSHSVPILIFLIYSTQNIFYMNQICMRAYLVLLYPL